MRSYEFYQLDVFTDRRFEGNPLAVFPEAEGIDDIEMQAIANEMNLSETVFVFPSDRALKRLRIFTPRQELPLAGHPVVGTWRLLAELGVTDRPEDGTVTVEQELLAGILPVDIEFRDSAPFQVTMTQAEFRSLGSVTDEDSIGRLANALGLERDEIADTDGIPIQAVSTGIGSLAVPVTTLTALGRIKVDPNSLSEIYLEAGAVGCYAFTFETIDPTSHVHARFFAPADAIPEDPATGSAAGSLSGHLFTNGNAPDTPFIIEQGDFMGRPSRIRAAVSGTGGSVEQVRIGGRAVIAAKGEVYLD